MGLMSVPGPLIDIPMVNILAHDNGFQLPSVSLIDSPSEFRKSLQI